MAKDLTSQLQSAKRARARGFITGRELADVALGIIAEAHRLHARHRITAAEEVRVVAAAQAETYPSSNTGWR